MTSLRPVAPAAVAWISRTLEDAGYETWAVGGAIRDALLGRASSEWDLATRATPPQMRHLFRRTVPLGIEHGTVGVLTREGVMYEVTTFRKDVETDGRHAVVEFADSISDDLARRDFTVNAIAWHVARQEFHDPFGGARDLQAGVLRTVGLPEERFREDYLRILRGLRFAGRLGLEIDGATWTAMRTLASHLPTLSPERIREELLKVLASAKPSQALELYATSGALGVLYPELEALRVTDGDAGLRAEQTERRGWDHALRVVDRLPSRLPHLRLAALLRPLERQDIAAILTRLRLSNALIEEVARWAGADCIPPSTASEEDVRRWLSTHGSTRLTAVARLDLAAARSGLGRDARDLAKAVVAAWRRARTVRRSRPPLAVGDLLVDGRDLIGMGLRPGPEFGEILEELLDWVLVDPARNEGRVLTARAREIAARRAGGV
ncbi:MAG: CCA tRNA nucleotidyltransferase [Gemmatimonadetes bacterium]|nr:CCA tRNA nucleotidyltransferase [Gemmatimonadota bacterium]MDA1104220.1 CCA tRNA nucleotidyltransferase [Gemmatimonadota bacterium]